MNAETQANPATITIVDTFDSLCGQVPLRPIRSDAEHDRAIAQINALIDRYPLFDEDDSAYADINDYMDVLGMIVERHESLIYGEPSDDDPIEAGEAE